MFDLEPGDLFLALPFVNGDAHAHVGQALLSGAALALVAEAWPTLPGLAPQLRARCVVVPDVVTAFRDLAAVFRRRLSCPVVAVAGCNGKTTTKDMLAALLSSPGRRVVKTPGTDNGFLGLPQTLCSREHRPNSNVSAVVLEIGIDAPLAMAQHARMVEPDIAVITALGPEHLGGLGDTATAVREELTLPACSPAARRVLPVDDPEIASRLSLLRGGDVAVLGGASLSPGAAAVPEGCAVLVFDARLSGIDSEVVMSFHPSGERGSPAHRFELRCPLPGVHNARNLALAAAAALLLGRSPEEIRAGFHTFEAPPLRSRVVPLPGGALLYEDCFNASPLSMRAALDVMGDPAWAARPKVVVLGDMLDLGAESARWHADLADRLSLLPDARVCLFGEAMRAVGERLSALGVPAERIRWLAAGDPVALVADMDLPEGAVVLVKGSRGMRLERVSRHLQLARASSRAAGGAASRPVATTAVTGAGRGVTVKVLTAALRWFGAGRAVVSLGHGDLLSSAGSGQLEAVVFTGLSAEDLPPGVDAETHLAHVAQLLVRGGGPAALVAFADDPAAGLLAEVVLPQTRVLRYGTGAAIGPVDLRATSIEVDEGGARVTLDGPAGFPAEIALRGAGRESALAAMAALLVVSALGGHPEEAAAYL